MIFRNLVEVAGWARQNKPTTERLAVSWERRVRLRLKRMFDMRSSALL